MRRALKLVRIVISGLLDSDCLLAFSLSLSLVLSAR